MRTGCGGRALTVRGDSRVTAVGSILRRYKLDELPQLWNVVAGDMLLIGSRPEVPDFVDVKSALWREVLAEKPGITDYSTVLFWNEEDVLARSGDPEEHYRRVLLPHKLVLHLIYRQQRDWVTDLQLLARSAIGAARSRHVPWFDRTHA